MTAQVELNLFAGAAFEHGVEWRGRTPAGGAGEAHDLSGYGFRFTLSRAGVVLFEASTESGAIVAPDPASGVIYLCFGAEALAAIEPGVYEHALIPVRDGEALTPLWVGRANVRQLGAASPPAVRIIGPAVPPLRVLRQGGNAVLASALAAAGAAFAGSALAMRVAALEAAAGGDAVPVEPVDLGPFAEELAALRAQIEGLSAPTPIAAHADGAGAETLAAIAARLTALEQSPAFDASWIEQALLLLSQRITIMEDAPNLSAHAWGGVLRPNRSPECDYAFGAVLLAALQSAGPAQAVHAPDPGAPETWDVVFASSATAAEVEAMQGVLDAAAAVERFALLDRGLKVTAIGDKRPGASVFPAAGLAGDTHSIMPLPVDAGVALGSRVVGARIYPPGDHTEVKLGGAGAQAEAAEMTR